MWEVVDSGVFDGDENKSERSKTHGRLRESEMHEVALDLLYLNRLDTEYCDRETEHCGAFSIYPLEIALQSLRDLTLPKKMHIVAANPLDSYFARTG